MGNFLKKKKKNAPTDPSQTKIEEQNRYQPKI